MEVREFLVERPEELRRVGEALLESGKRVFILTGPLGAGKTRLVQEFGKLIGVDEPITSPTFSIQNIYNGIPPIYHYDLYQKGVDYFLKLGLLEELEREGFHFLEWGEGLKSILEEFGFPVGVVEIEPEGERRRVKCLF
ncbi:MAG: tRNA (adenosine(37)-N6)-threonylcarbamoyltransferase complex ATPase subunit type 1 TsaE [Campylobacterales bacterium]